MLPNSIKKESKIKKLFNTKIVIESKTKKETEFKSKTLSIMWILPTTLEEEDISNQYTMG